MKKLISMILAVMLVLSASSAAVFADGGKDREAKDKISGNTFSDSDEVSWAQKAIDKLKVKGMLKGDKGKFQPHRSVTQLEAIIMSLRVMDKEAEALSLTTLPKKYKGEEVQKWAVGYIKEAADAGILDTVDLMYFKPSAPVKRHEMAKYIIRAIGKDSDALKHMDEELPFIDASAVPKGSIGYVYLANKLGLMNGDGKRFNPMGTLSRAEMAVLFYNLDNKIDNLYDINEFKGLVDSISEHKLVLKIGALKRSFDVASDVVVFKGTKKVAYSTINVGAKVLLKTNNDVVEYIEIINLNDASDNKIITSYSGKLTAIGNGDPVTLTVRMEEMTAVFTVTDNTEFLFDGVKGTVSDLKIGDEIKVAVDDSNKAMKVTVDRELDTPVVTEAEGKMTAIDLVGAFHISIDGVTYNLSKDAEVKLDDASAELADLHVGMDLKAELKDNVVVSIEAE